MQNSKVILVTGGDGLLGTGLKAVVENMEATDESFVFISRKDVDLKIYNDVAKIFEKHKPYAVIHFAALVGGLFKNMNNSFQMLDTNIEIDRNILNCCTKYEVSKCILCLSTCVFPEKASYPLVEDMLHNGPPSETNFGFAFAKRHSDILARALNESQKITKFIRIVPCNVYGPGDNFNLEEGHVVGGLIHKAHIAKQNGTPLKVLGSGKSLRQFIFSPDVGRLVIKILREYENTDSIMLTVDEKDEISIKDAAEIIRKEVGIKQELEFDTSFGDGVYKKTASNAKMRHLWPDFPFTSFADGIHLTVEWLKKNYDTARK